MICSTESNNDWRLAAKHEAPPPQTRGHTHPTLTHAIVRQLFPVQPMIESASLTLHPPLTFTYENSYLECQFPQGPPAAIA